MHVSSTTIIVTHMRPSSNCLLATEFEGLNVFLQAPHSQPRQWLQPHQKSQSISKEELFHAGCKVIGVDRIGLLAVHIRARAPTTYESWRSKQCTAPRWFCWVSGKMQDFSRSRASVVIYLLVENHVQDLFQIWKPLWKLRISP